MEGRKGGQPLPVQQSNGTLLAESEDWLADGLGDGTGHFFGKRVLSPTPSGPVLQTVAHHWAELEAFKRIRREQNAKRFQLRVLSAAKAFSKAEMVRHFSFPGTC